MVQTAIEIIQQVGLLTLFVVAFVYVRHFASPLSKSIYRDVYLGLLFGVMITVAVLNPIVIAEGATFDPRSGPAILAGVFAGPVGALVAGAIGAAVRYFIVGGPIALGGATGFAFYAAFSICAGIVIRRRNITLSPLCLVVLGMLGAISVLPAFFVSLDVPTALTVLKKGGLIFLANNILSTVVVGIFIVQGSKLLSYSQRLESEIKENTRLARIAHVTTNMVIITDEKGFTEWANPALERITGYSADELIGKKPGDVLQGPDTDPATIAHMSEQIAKGEGFKVEVLNYTKEGESYWLQIDCEPYKDVDGTKKFMAIEVDITKRKMIEETLARKQNELELALNHLSGALVYTDAEMRIVIRSENMQKLYDVPEEYLAPGAYYPDFLRYLAERGDYGEGTVEELIESRIASLRSPSEDMFVDRLPDGKIYGVRRTLAPSGGTITIVSDVTDQIRLNERLEVAIANAEQASRAKSEFLATMSHEIRTPMTGILGFADLLLDDDLNEEAKEKVQRIKNSAASLLTIINDILDLSKLDANKLEIERVNFRPTDIVNEVTTMFQQTCPPDKKERLSISAKVSESFPAAICADPSRLRQILINLVGNAVKFTDSGTVTLYADRENGQNVIRFRVVDTGLGIPNNVQRQIFEDFVQADASISREFHGTGLGLAICNRLVERMGGKIGVESEVGEGSTFWFTLPFEPVAAGAELISPPSIEPGIDTGNRKLSILVAEDNEINQIIIKAMLDRMGHTCTMANNGAEAVDAVRKSDFDLILMDVRMPELSGPDATRKIRRLPGSKAGIPIIALTADVLAENRQSYFDAGMVDCIAKPINQVQLAVAIDKAFADATSMVPVPQAEAVEDIELTVDLQEATSRLGLPEATVVALLKKFSTSYGDVAKRFEDFAKAKDLDAMKQLGHALKGVSGSLGMTAISEYASRIEVAAKSKDIEEAELCIAVLAKLIRGAVTSIGELTGKKPG